MTRSIHSHLYGFCPPPFISALLKLIDSSRDTQTTFPGLSDDFPTEFLDPTELAAFGISGGSSPDLILLSLRCLSNLLEAHSPSISTFVSNGGVKILVKKLGDVEYIDLAEQVLAVLDKVAREFPGVIVKEGGIGGVLRYIDFLGVHVQRMAVGIARDAVRGLGPLSTSTTPLGENGDKPSIFDMVLEVVPILGGLMNYSDHRVADGAVKTLARIVDWVSRDSNKLEKIVGDGNFARTAITLALSTTTSSGKAGLFCGLIKMLTGISKGSTSLKFKIATEWGGIDLIHNVLTGSSGDDKEFQNHLNDSILKVIEKRSLDEINDILALLVEMLPPLPKDGSWSFGISPPNKNDNLTIRSSTTNLSNSSNGNGSGSSSASATSITKEELKERQSIILEKIRFTLIPVLVDVFSATVNPIARRHVVDSVAKVIASSDSKDIERLIKEISGFGKFICELVAYGETVFGGQKSNSVNSSEISSSSSSLSYANPSIISLSRPSSHHHQQQGNNDKEVRESATFAGVGLQIAKLVIERGGEAGMIALVREGIGSECDRILQVSSSSILSSLSSTSEDNQSIKDSLHEMNSPMKSNREEISDEDMDMTNIGAEMRALMERAEDLLRDRLSGNNDSGNNINSEQQPPPQQQQQQQQQSQEKEQTEKNSGKEKEPTTHIPTTSTSTTATTSDATSTTGPSNSTRSANLDSPTSAERTLLATMRSMMERLGRGESQSSFSSRDPTTIIAITGDRVSLSECKSWIISTAQFIRKELNANQMEGVASEDMKIWANMLKGIMSPPENDPALFNILKKIAERFSGRAGGVTGYEILGSGIIDGLATYLTHSSMDSSSDSTIFPSTDSLFTTANTTFHSTIPRIIRVQLFLHVFMNGPLPSGFHTPSYVPDAYPGLVKRLQESLSRVERFELVSAIPNSGGGGGGDFVSMNSHFLYGLGGSGFNEMTLHSPSMQLTRQMKLKLVAEDTDNIPNQYAAMVVSVHAVATFKVLEEYLRGRVGPQKITHIPPLSSNKRNVNENDKESMDTDAPINTTEEEEDEDDEDYEDDDEMEDDEEDDDTDYMDTEV